MRLRIVSLLAMAFGTLLCAFGVQARMMLAADGKGQILHYPYYTVLGGYDTYISVVNHSVDTKAVRVRFLESKNDRITLEFNLFLAPRDLWTGAITAIQTPPGAGLAIATLKTADTSCTYPQIPGAGVQFRAFAFVEKDEAGEIIDASPTRANQGFIEIIEMGVVTDPRITVATQHINGVPKSCSALNDMYASSTPTGISPAFENSLAAPTGKLSGTASLVNVAGGTDYSYDAVAIVDAFRKSQHFIPGSNGQGNDRLSKPSLVDANRSVTITHAGQTYFADFADGIDAVSALYQRAVIDNEWITDPAIGAGTDFVVAMPTRRYHMGEGSTALPRKPFLKPFGKNGAPEPVYTQIYDRETKTQSEVTLDFCAAPPGPPGPSNDCHVSVFTFRQSNVLAAPSVKQFGPGQSFGFNSSGVGRMGFVTPESNDTRIPSAENAARVLSTVGNNNSVDGVPCKEIVFRGLPVTAFAVQKYANGNVGGVLSNYGGLFQHKYERAIDCIQ
jgi:hypothetical protein